MKVLVLLGGESDEREVSLRSGKAVAKALQANGHDVSEYDPAGGYEGLTQFVDRVGCVFPILHGKGGEDGTIQAELEKLNFKYLGSDSTASKLCFDKDEFKKILNKLSILTPKWEIVDKNSIKKSELANHPYVLKPIDGGSTIDTYIVRDPTTTSYDKQVFERHERMLLEELILGDEITVPILGNSALPVIEIIPPEGKEFDYENKYNGASQELCPPRNIAQDQQEEAQRLAEKIHKAVDAKHLSRTDIMITPEGKQLVLELNTIPGLTAQSLFPKAAKAAGMTFESLVQKLVEMACTV